MSRIAKLRWVCIIVCIAAWGIQVRADSADSALKITAFADVYYAHYSDSVAVNTFQKFPTVSPRSGNFGLNALVVSGDYATSNVRGTASLHWGDIASSAWSPSFNSLLEAHLGVLLSNNLWLDAGLFRTHFGTESLYPRENFCSSISVPTFYEPYYEAGARLQYTPSSDFSASLFLLNGYNIFEDNNRSKSVGLLLNYAISDKGSVGYSNYIGDDSPDGDTLSHLRIHNNLFWNHEFGRLKLQVGVDYGMQQHSTIHADTIRVKVNDSTSLSIENQASKSTASMFSVLVNLKYTIMTNTALYARYDMLSDPDGFMTGIMMQSNGVRSGFKETGITFGAEYLPTSKSYVRLEFRSITMNEFQKIFMDGSTSTNARTEVLVNFGVSL